MVKYLINRPEFELGHKADNFVSNLRALNFQVIQTYIIISILVKLT